GRLESTSPPCVYLTLLVDCSFRHSVTLVSYCYSYSATIRVPRERTMPSHSCALRAEALFGYILEKCRNIIDASADNLSALVKLIEDSELVYD
ncbi:MAG: hypothetical protein ACK53Y_08735, partial [bacterium]